MRKICQISIYVQKALPKQGFLYVTEELRRDCDGIDRDETADLAAVLEADYAVDLGEEGVVLAAAYVCSGLERCSALTNQDGATGDSFAAEALNAESLCIRVAAVFRRT
jgi:hypothetical protein